MHIEIKICGFTEPVGLLAAVEAGVDSVGLVLDPSPRKLSLEQAGELAKLVPDHVELVAVCGRPSVEEVVMIAERLQPDSIQLMADALPPAALGLSILPAFEDGADLVDRVRKYCLKHSDPRPVVLADGPQPGTGIPADWNRVEQLADSTRLVLAGGLTPNNVGQAIRRMNLHGVDVSSGVEQSPGIKDPQQIQAFVAAVRNAEQRMVG